ncbi:hypothetical protein WDU94_005540 [Cyamophila willieti]
MSKISISSKDIIQFAQKKVEKSGKTLSGIEEIRSCLAILDPECEDRAESDLQRSVVAILLLPYLVGIPSSAGGKRKKYSRTDIADSFIIKVNSETDLLAQEATLRERGGRVQPHIVYVGTSPVHPNKVYVCFDDVKYEVENIVVAVDTTFKIFMTLNAMYPEASKDVWLLIQLGFFCIETIYDPPLTKVNMTLKNLLVHLKMYADKY